MNALADALLWQIRLQQGRAVGFPMNTVTRMNFVRFWNEGEWLALQTARLCLKHRAGS